jgi:hypothetical protein
VICPVPTGWTAAKRPDQPPSRRALALARPRLRERRAEMSDVVAAVLAAMKDDHATA